MGIDKILVALFSIGGIAFVYWFFLMKKDDEAVVFPFRKVNLQLLTLSAKTPALALKKWFCLNSKSENIYG